MGRIVQRVVVPLLALTLVLAACVAPSTPTPKPTPTAKPVYSLFQIEYRLFAAYPDFFWCDPDYYPIGRPGQEEKSSIDQFATIKANQAEFSAILEHLSLPHKVDYTDAEKLEIYREHKKLTYAVQMTAVAGAGYQFTLRTGQGQGYRLEGSITPSGEITVAKKEASFNTCPICLARGTLIDTPAGPVPVEQLSVGLLVWTIDVSGERVAVPVIEIRTTPVPPSFQVVRVELSDGRSISASPGHPTAEGRALGGYQVGEALGGVVVVATERVDYDGGATYDILPSGATGLYWANGVLLKSTLATR